jgi:hypothetical protein
MNRTNYTIGILTITAIVLLIANFCLTPPRVIASDVIKDRDYSVATAHSLSGGDALYIIDNRTGLLGVFTYDTGTRSLAPRVTRPVSDAFAGR